jgi:hypothetical protein
MDINPFEIAGKTVRRTFETLDDTYNLLEDSIFASSPMRFVAPHANFAESNTENIMEAADKALAHNDIEEAHYQFRREIYFSSLIDRLAGSPNEVAAKAGLDAIEQKSSACAIHNATIEAWTRRMYR